MNDAFVNCREEINRCNKCGTCRSVCPIFREMGAEQFVARGKVQLVNAWLEEKLATTPKFGELLSLCLLCGVCSLTCPSQVQVDQIILAARSELVSRKGQSFLKKMIFRNVLPSETALNTAGGLLSLYQRLGMQGLVRKTGLLKLLPGSLAETEQMLPPVPAVPFRKRSGRILKAAGEKLRVAYFVGCATNLLFPSAAQAVVDVLRRNQISVYIPPQVCCGIPALSSGDRQTALKLARENVDRFKELPVDIVVTDCGSCGSTLQQYGELLQTEAAAKFSAKIVDISAFLIENTDFTKGLLPVDECVTYHDPCHLKRGMGVSREPRQILKAIPGLIFKEMPEADTCCGSSGTFSLTNYSLSMRIADRKIANIAGTESGVVATGCPACQMQLRHGFKRSGRNIRVVHPVEILAQSTFGRTAGSE